MRTRSRALLSVFVPGVLAAGLLSAAGPASATTPGWIDHGFGGEAGSTQTAAATSATDAQGRTYVLNRVTGSATVTRWTANGTIDRGWGENGSVTLPMGSQNSVWLVPVADGSVLVDVPGTTLRRITPAGALDATFGKDGVLALPPADAQSGAAEARIVVRPDGSYVVAEYTSGTQDTRLAAFSPSGELLTGFGTGGRATVPGIRMTDLALDGSSVVAVGRPDSTDPDPKRTVVARVTAAGALDPTFGSGGLVTLKDGQADNVRRSVEPIVTVQGGKVFLPVQLVPNLSWRVHLGVVRLTAAGAPDPGFGTTVVGLAGTALAVQDHFVDTKDCQPQPEEVIPSASGVALLSAEHCTDEQDPGALLVHRFTNAGVPDAAFGDRGQLLVSEIGGKAIARSFAPGYGIQPDGKLILGANLQGGRFALARVNTTATTAAGGYVPVEPSRLLDTRNGTGAPKAQVAAGGTVTLQVTGRGGVPANAGAVVLNVAGTQNAGGYVTVYPTGSAVPTVSNLNLTAAETRANLVTVKLGTGGKVSLRNGSQKPLHLIGDVVGYYTPTSAIRVAGSFQPLTPARLLDTRTGNGAPKARAQSGRPVALKVTNHGGVPETNVSAVVLNVTAVNPTKGGYLTVYPNDIARPTISTLNFAAGRTVANLTTVPVGKDGKVALALTGTDSDLLADVAGYYVGGTPTAPGTYVPLTPTRAMDTRVAFPTGPGQPDTSVRPVGPEEWPYLAVLGRTGVPETGVAAVVMNVTAVDAQAGTTVTVRDRWESNVSLYSSLNATQGATVAGMAVPSVGSLGVAFQNQGGAVHLIADVGGYFRS